MQTNTKKLKLDWHNFVKTFDEAQPISHAMDMVFDPDAARQVKHILELDETCQSQCYEILLRITLVQKNIPGMCAHICAQQHLTAKMVRLFVQLENFEHYLPQLIGKHQASEQDCKLLFENWPASNKALNNVEQIVQTVVDVLRAHPQRIIQVALVHNFGNLTESLVGLLIDMVDLFKHNSEWTFYWLCLVSMFTVPKGATQVVHVKELVQPYFNSRFKFILVATIRVWEALVCSNVEHISLKDVEYLFNCFDKGIWNQEILSDPSAVSWNANLDPEIFSAAVLQRIFYKNMNRLDLIRLTEQALLQTTNPALFARGLKLAVFTKSDSELQQYIPTAIKLFENPKNRSIGSVDAIFCFLRANVDKARRCMLTQAVLFCLNQNNTMLSVL